LRHRDGCEALDRAECKRDRRHPAGNGTVTGNLNVSSAGTVKAAVPNINDPATLSVNGNYNQSGGTLVTLLQGTAAGQVGTVNLQGGTLQASFVSPLPPRRDRPSAM
jgi:hypothetical protein